LFDSANSTTIPSSTGRTPRRHQSDTPTASTTRDRYGRVVSGGLDFLADELLSGDEDELVGTGRAKNPARGPWHTSPLSEDEASEDGRAGFFDAFGDIIMESIDLEDMDISESWPLEDCEADKFRLLLSDPEYELSSLFEAKGINGRKISSDVFNVSREGSANQRGFSLEELQNSTGPAATSNPIGMTQEDGPAIFRNERSQMLTKRLRRAYGGYPATSAGAAAEVSRQTSPVSSVASSSDRKSAAGGALMAVRAQRSAQEDSP